MSTINLLPDDYFHRRRQWRANVMCLCLFVVVMCGVVGGWMVSQQSQAHTLAVRDRVNASYADAVKLIEQMQQLQVQKARMLAKAEVAASLVERVPRSYLLAQITRSLPKGASLEQFKLFPKTIRVAPSRRATKFDKATGKKREAQPQYRVVIEIRGLAATDVHVAQFMANLLRQPLMESVELGYSEEKVIEKVAAREFQITMTIKPGVDVIDTLPRTDQAKKDADKAEAGAKS